MTILEMALAGYHGPALADVCPPKKDPCRRILAALGLVEGAIPRVDDESLARYFDYLSTSLQLPFIAYYPAPKNAQERREFRLTVLELIDPRMHMGDPFDGLYVKTRKGTFEVNLPLGEIFTPQGSVNFELIEDYWHWFWNWR